MVERLFLRTGVAVDRQMRVRALVGHSEELLRSAWSSSNSEKQYEDM